MKRTWTIIGVGDVPGRLKWYQSLFGQPATVPAHDYFGQILDSDGTVLLCLHEWGAHEHPSLMSPDHGTPGNGLLLFFRVDDFDLALQRARSLVTRLEEELLRGALMQGVICRLLQGRIKRGDGHESLNLPFPFYSMGREREGRWSDGAREKRSAGKKRRRTSRLFSEGLPLRSRTGSMREQTKEYPARGKDSGGVCGLGNEPSTDLRLSPRACLTRQAGFAAARPAANWSRSAAGG